MSDFAKDANVPINDCISRQAAIDALSTPHGILYPIRTIEALPSAERRGRWVKGDEMADYPRVPYKPWETYCSCCGEIKEQSNDGFCGNCGARMDEVEE